MGKEILIDGYNLMHQMLEIRDRMAKDPEGARERLLHRLASHAAAGNVRITAVFDGKGSATTRSGVRVLFSGPYESADQVIKRMVDTESRNGDKIVVTSDREIQFFAKQCGAQVLSSQQFGRELAEKSQTKQAVPDKYDKHLSRAEIDEWMKLFSQKSGNG